MKHIKSRKHSGAGVFGCAQGLAGAARLATGIALALPGLASAEIPRGFWDAFHALGTPPASPAAGVRWLRRVDRAGETLLVEGEGGRITLEGGGEIVLVKFMPRPCGD